MVEVLMIVTRASFKQASPVEPKGAYADMRPLAQLFAYRPMHAATTLDTLHWIDANPTPRNGYELDRGARLEKKALLKRGGISPLALLLPSADTTTQ